MGEDPRGAQHMGVVEWALLGVLAAVWGSAFFFGKVALGEVGPLTLVATRLVVGSLALNLILLATRQRLPNNWHDWRRLITMGLIGVFVPFSLIFWGEVRIDSGLAGVLNATVPVFSVLLGHALRYQPLTLLRSLGALAGLLGVAVMLGLELLNGLSSNVGPEAAVLCAAVLYAVSAFYGRRLKDIPALVSAAGMVTAMACVSLPVALVVEHPWARRLADGTLHIGWPSAVALGSLLGLGLLCTAFAYVLYFHMLARVGPTNALLSTYLIPVSAVLLGVLVLHERLMARHLAGIALIALGLVLIDGRMFGALRPRATAQIAAVAPTPIHPQD